MGKKKKKQDKKTNTKKEKYAKFRKDKPSVVVFKEPDRSEEETKSQRDEEFKIERFLRARRAPKEKIPPGRRVDKRNYR